MRSGFNKSKKEEENSSFFLKKIHLNNLFIFKKTIFQRGKDHGSSTDNVTMIMDHFRFWKIKQKRDQNDIKNKA